MSGSIITYDDAAFRLAIPAFADTVLYPEELISSQWNNAINYISDLNVGWLNNNPNSNSRTYSIQLMTAHILTIANDVAAAGSGGQLGFVQEATVDKVHVTLSPPAGKDAFDYWLNLTPYGTQLLALLSAKAAGGFYVGGRPELAAFRRVGSLRSRFGYWC